MTNFRENKMRTQRCCFDKSGVDFQKKLGNRPILFSYTQHLYMPLLYTYYYLPQVEFNIHSNSNTKRKHIQIVPIRPSSIHTQPHSCIEITLFYSRVISNEHFVYIKTVINYCFIIFILFFFCYRSRMVWICYYTCSWSDFFYNKDNSFM